MINLQSRIKELRDPAKDAPGHGRLHQSTEFRPEANMSVEECDSKEAQEIEMEIKETDHINEILCAMESRFYAVARHTKMRERASKFKELDDHMRYIHDELQENERKCKEWHTDIENRKKENSSSTLVQALSNLVSMWSRKILEAHLTYMEVLKRTSHYREKANLWLAKKLSPKLDSDRLKKLEDMNEESQDKILIQIQEQQDELDDMVWEINKNNMRAQMVEEKTEKLKAIWEEVYNIVEMNDIHINQISDALNNTKEYTLKSAVTIQEAENFQIKALRAKYYTACIVLVLGLIVAFAVYVIVFK